MNHTALIGFGLLAILAVLACGCTAQAPSAAMTASGTPPATTPAAPVLIGTWTGPMQTYDEGTGFSDFGNVPISLVITEQKGRIFAGSIQFVVNGSRTSTPIAGVIGRDGRTFSLMERSYGYATGDIVTDDLIELTWMHDGSPYGVALDTLRRE